MDSHLADFDSNPGAGEEEIEALLRGRPPGRRQGAPAVHGL